MAFAYSVSLDDPTQSSNDALLVTDTLAAAAQWARYIDGLGTIDIQVTVGNLTGDELGEGGSADFVADGTDGLRTVMEPGADVELTTGNDPNGAAPDIEITIDANSLESLLFFNPDPAQAASVPPDKIDAESVLIHEIGHGLGIDGYRDPSTGALAGAETPWDRLVQINSDGTAVFLGAAADQIYGGPVPVTTLQNGEQYYHLGNSTSDAASADIMSGLGIGAGERYGVSPLDVAIMKDLGLSTTPPPLLGSVSHDLTGIGGEIEALYGAVLGRAPDPLGLETYVGQVEAGASADDIAADLLASGEHTARDGDYEQVPAATFVAQLYQTAFGRAPDPAGLQAYTNAIAQGMAREDVASAIALSPEHQNDLGSVLQAGIFAPDPTDCGIARLYYGIFDRAPDADGLQHWQTAAADGSSLGGIAQAFVGSTEFQSAHAGQSAAAFVTDLYQGALGRNPDTGGLQAYVSALGGGMSQGAVALAISESPEAQNHLATAVEVNHVVT